MPNVFSPARRRVRARAAQPVPFARAICAGALLAAVLAPLAHSLVAQPPAPAARADTARAGTAARGARRGDTARVLAPVRVTARVAPRTVTFLPERHGAALLTGKKTEVLLVDSVGANAAQNVARQVLGRVPGLVVAETEGSGFPSNVSVRLGRGDGGVRTSYVRAHAPRPAIAQRHIRSRAEAVAPCPTLRKWTALRRRLHRGRCAATARA